MSNKQVCGVPSLTLGPCDLPRGHEDRMHASGPDGFYANCGICREPLQAGRWNVPPNDERNIIAYICDLCVEADGK